MQNQLIPRADIEAARERVASHLPASPLLFSSHYSARIGAEIYLKLEMLQPTHSFKVRGAFNAIAALPEAQRQRGVVTASGGNHGLGVALVASTMGITATIYLPTSTPENKINAIRALGADIELLGDAWDEANEVALRVAREDGRPYIHPFDDTFVMAGQSTIVTELLEQMDRVDVIVVSVGGGGLISGILSAVRHYSPATRVVAVETEGADCMTQSVRAGQIVELAAITSIAESLGAKKTGARQYQIVSEYVADMVVVSDDAALHALVEFLDTEKMLVEPAASCCLAALTDGHIAIHPGEKVAVIVCGANVSWQQVRDWQAG